MNFVYELLCELWISELVGYIKDIPSRNELLAIAIKNYEEEADIKVLFPRTPLLDMFTAGHIFCLGL